MTNYLHIELDAEFDLSVPDIEGLIHAEIPNDVRPVILHTFEFQTTDHPTQTNVLIKLANEFRVFGCDPHTKAESVDVENDLRNMLTDFEPLFESERLEFFKGRLEFTDVNLISTPKPMAEPEAAKLPYELEITGTGENAFQFGSYLTSELKLLFLIEDNDFTGEGIKRKILEIVEAVEPVCNLEAFEQLKQQIADVSLRPQYRMSTDDYVLNVSLKKRYVF